MKRKVFIALLLCMTFTFGNFKSVFSTTYENKELISYSGSYQLEKEYISKWLELNRYGINRISNPIELFNINGDVEAVCFDINTSGYIIINIHNYDITEFSFDAKKPISDKKIIYDGPLKYYIEEQGKLINVKTNKAYSKSLFQINKPRVTLSNSEKYRKLTSIINDTDLEVRSSFFENGFLSNSLVTWSSSYYCSVDASAILLKYLSMYKDYRFLPSGYTTNNKVQEFLVNNRYILDQSNSPSDVAYGGVPYMVYDGSMLVTKYSKGITGYLSDMSLSHYSVYWSMYNFNTIKQQINNNNPVYTSIDSNNSPWSENHAVVTHGYMVGYDGVPFIIVNDNFGNNNISINGSQSYFTTKGMWYIN